VMLGYYNNEEATAAAFTEEGYFKTGDFGYMDEDGYLYITGRKKNIIILDNGKNVYPEEIEEYLERIEVIKECVVIGRENANGEVVITALIYPDYDMFKGCEESEIIDKMRNEVAKVNKLLPTFKQIRNIELKKTEFEKTTTKKIIRYKLS
jgi:long-chain acyl-CoA synthetase